MSTITKEFTKEQLIEQAKKNIEVLRGAVEKIPGASDAAVIHLKLAEITLASLEAEPVAYSLIFRNMDGVLNDYVNANTTFSTIEKAQTYGRGGSYVRQNDGSLKWVSDPSLDPVVVPLYAAPPASVSVPDTATPQSMRAMFCQLDDSECAIAADVWNACRAAMLQGAEHVTAAYKLPANTPCKDAPEHIWLQTAGVWPENGEFSELTWCSDNQHPDDTLYVRADVVAGNSPVIPDGWVMVPVEPTAEMISSGIAAHYERNQIQIHDRPAPGPMECAYVAMLAAAPQQEVK